MTKVAYKVNTTNPNLPNGFVIDHFETEQDQVEGYLVVDKDVFQRLLLNNVTTLRQHEMTQGIVGGPGTPLATLRPASEAQPIDQALMEQKKKAYEEELAKRQADAELFQQFLAWKKSLGDGS